MSEAQSIDRGRAIPVRTESGHRFGKRSWLDAAMSAYALMDAEELRRFHDFVDRSRRREDQR